MMGESEMDILDRQLADGEIGIREYRSLTAALNSNKPKAEPKVSAKIVGGLVLLSLVARGGHALLRGRLSFRRGQATAGR